MAEAAISFAVERLGDALIHKVNFLMNVKDQVQWLKSELESMLCFLKDAAEKQGNNENENLIRKWISDVREVARDAEDTIEIFILKLDAPTRKRDLVRKWAGFPTHVSHLNRVGMKIESIRTRLDEIAKRRERYGIRDLGDVRTEASLRSSAEMVERRRRRAARVQKDIDVVGLNEDTDHLIKNVILEQGKVGLSFTAIVGMGGIGKSTLARKIYNHPTIRKQFEKRAWVVVSSEFAEEDILMQIIHQLSHSLNPDESKALELIKEKLRRQELLQEMLRKRLKGKRYFIVLDDVWETKDWELLKDAFPDEQGRLLFTSRKEIFRKHEAYIHKMKVLKSDESWELFRKTTMIGERFSRELEGTSRKILKKCHGLPLAIIIAGGLLVNESKSGWDKVLKQMNNFGSETNEIGKNVLPILELSYRNLPSNLKSCFLCLAFFKEDTVIRARSLVHIWVALGLVKVQEGGQESVEKIGRRYLNELIKRNLILVKGSLNFENQPKACFVHDLLRELSIKKAKEEIGFESLIVENDNESSSSSSSLKPRHRVVRGIGKSVFQVEMSDQSKHLRSLFLHVKIPGNGDDVEFGTPSYWKGFELLRILDIECDQLLRLPSTIRSLIGIRYLKLRGADGMTLPSWLDDLKNLEVLDIADESNKQQFWRMVTFPDVTWKMNSLRHLYINELHIFSQAMRKSSWHNLETLKYIWSDEVLSIQRCGRLRTLGIHVRREGLAEMGRLIMDCTALQALHLRWDYKLVLEELIPFPNALHNLSKLKLLGRMPTCPSADKFPINITHLTLSQFGNVENDPMQVLSKLPKLLFLKLDIVFVIRMEVLHEGFPQLEVLHLMNTTFKEIYIEGEMPMPRLQLLQIYKCPRLNTKYLKERLSHAQIIITDI